MMMVLLDQMMPQMKWMKVRYIEHVNNGAGITNKGEEKMIFLQFVKIFHNNFLFV